MQKRIKALKDWVDPIIIIGLVVSLGISSYMLITGQDKVSGLIVGLLSTILTFLIDIIARINKSERTLLESNKLTKLFEKSPISGNLRDIADDFAKVNEYNFDHFQKLANNKIVECKSYIRELASGSIQALSNSLEEYSGHKAFANAQLCVNAVDFGQKRFWESEAGRNYLKSNKEAIDRGVRVKRIFAISRKEIEEHSSVLKAQIAAGVVCKIVSPNRVEKEYMVIDDKVGVEIFFDQSRNYVSERIIVDPSLVADARERFDLIESFSFSADIKDDD